MTRIDDADQYALATSAAGRLMSPLGTARVRFALARRPGDEVATRARELAPLAAAAESLDLPAESVGLAFELAALSPELDPGDARDLAILALGVLAALARGSTRVPLLSSGDAERRFLRELFSAFASGPGEVDRLIGRLRALLESGRARPVIGAPGEHTPLVDEDGNLYLERMRREEVRFVEAIAARMSRTRAAAADPSIAGALDAVEARPGVGPRGPVRLSNEQREAVRRAVSQPLTVISGGPGTGKTSVVVAILRVLVHLGLGPEAIALAAPTGKAAHRIQESVRLGLQALDAPSPADARLTAHPPEARTLHRLLGYAPALGRFRHHENNRLAERVVIVDESSMIDLLLMERLVRAVRDDARLVLIGDAEQLPSVEAGEVLRDIAEGGRHELPDLAVTLTQSYRMDPSDPAGRNILSVARSVRDGEHQRLLQAGAGERIATRRRAREVHFQKVELVPGGALRELLDRWYLERIEEGLPEFDRLSRKVYHLEEGGFRPSEAGELSALLSHYESSRILCVTRSAALPTGAAAINLALHDRLTAASRFQARRGVSRYLPGEPVIVERNDYERRLFNGDQGVVVEVQEGPAPPAPMVVLRSSTGEGFAVHPLDVFGDELALAYATTVHKAQGSELDHVLLVLPDRDLGLTTREVLYTALTRARRSVIIAADRPILERGIERTIRRWSGVRERLRPLLSRPLV